jgi:hypothetical protein
MQPSCRSCMDTTHKLPCTKSASPVAVPSPRARHRESRRRTVFGRSKYALCHEEESLRHVELPSLGVWKKRGEQDLQRHTRGPAGILESRRVEIGFECWVFRRFSKSVSARTASAPAGPDSPGSLHQLQVGQGSQVRCRLDQPISCRTDILSMALAAVACTSSNTRSLDSNNTPAPSANELNS